jgi:hypothetical protein
MILLAWLFFVAAQVADVVTTNRGLKLPGVTEANPVIAWCMARFGRAWWVPKAVFPVAVFAAVGALENPVAVFVGGAILAALALRNYRIVRVKS